MQQSVKKHAAHGFSQFRLTSNLINNLSQFDLTPTAKLVLVYLSNCYNPKKAEMFPKQKTIAAKIGVSKASVIRAICELHKEGLIVSERKYTLRYKFTSKIVSKPLENEKIFDDNNLQVETSQNETLEHCNLQPACIEQKKEQKKEPQNVVEYKILKKYAESKGAKNVGAYINALKKSGTADKIINDYKLTENANKYWENNAKETSKLIKEIEVYKQDAVPPTAVWKNLKAQLMK